MDPNKLEKGMMYNFADSIRKKIRVVIYVRETINHYIFADDSEEDWIDHTTVKTSISELDNSDENE